MLDFVRTGAGIAFAMAFALPSIGQSIEGGGVDLIFSQNPIYDEFGEVVDYQSVYERATADLQINLPLTLPVSVRGSALNGPAFWGDTTTWDSVPLAFARAFPITASIVGPIFGDLPTPTSTIESVEALLNGGPTESTIGIPVKIGAVELPGLELNFNPGAELRWNVNIPASASVIGNQAARVQNLSIASSGSLTGNANMIVREDFLNGGLFADAKGHVEGDFVNSGADSAGDRTVLSGGVLTVDGTVLNETGAAIFGHGRIEGSLNNSGTIVANTGNLTLKSDSFLGSGTLGAETSSTLKLQNFTNTPVALGQAVVLTGGTLDTDHSFVTSGSGVVRGFGEITGDVGGHVLAEGGTLSLRASDDFVAGALLEAASDGVLEWQPTSGLQINNGNRSGSVMRALEGGTLRFDHPTASWTYYSNDGLIEVMDGGVVEIGDNTQIHGEGQITVQSGGTLSAENDVTFNQLIDNQGTMELDGVTININDQWRNLGSVVMTDNARINLTGELDNAVDLSITGDGTGRLVLSGGGRSAKGRRPVRSPSTVISPPAPVSWNSASRG